MNKFSARPSANTAKVPIKAQSQGFTLIELMISLTIACILLAVVAPGFFSYSAKSASLQTVQTLSGFVRFTRNHALNNQQNTVLCPSINGKECDENWESGTLIYEDRNQDYKLNEGDIIINFSSPLSKKGTITWTAMRNYIAFSGEGLSGNSAGSFIYCPNNKNEEFAHALIISFSGKVRFAKDNNQDGIKESGNQRNIACL